MNIEISYDSSANSAPAGFRTAVNAAVSYLDSEISSPITVTIDFGWGEVDGQRLDSSSVGESLSNGDNYTYAQVRSALVKSATSSDDFASIAALPSIDPTHGAQFFVANAEEKALGLTPSPGGPDGWVGLSSTTAFTFDPNNRAVGGAYDAIGILEHEITEVLGRTSAVGQTLTDGSSYATPLDLFRYTGPGQLSPTADSAYFSVDGQHMLLPFNNPVNGGDSGDWADSVYADSFTEAASTDTVLAVSPTDLREMDVLGFTLAGSGVASGGHAALDFNGDGLSDILWMNASTDQISEWWGTSQGFTQDTFLANPESGWGVAAAGDFTGDGRADLVWFNPSTNAISEWQSTGAGFNTNTFYATVPAGWSVAGAGDFNGDGKSDLVWFNASTQALSEWQSTGSGFTQNTYYGTVGSGWSIAGVGDFSGDGKSDLVWFNSSTQGVSTWTSTGSGFTPNTFYTTVGAGWGIAGVGDFNGDGKSDLLWFNTSTHAVSEWQSTGAGFTTNTFYATVGAGWTIAQVGDFNGDGKADILWYNTQTHAVSEWQSTGSGFSQNTAYATVASGWTPFDPTHTGLYLV